MYSSNRSFLHEDGKFSTVFTDLIVEAPLEIVLNDLESILIMFTPEMTRELVIGFLFTEGIVGDASDVVDCVITSSGEGNERVITARVTISGDKIQFLKQDRRRISYSSCGICGKGSFEEVKKGLSRVRSRHRFSIDVLKRLPATLLLCQPLYQKTGGAHAAILLDAGGEPLIHCEDVGRHNALDKVIGGSLLKGISFGDKILISSGRASLEMVLKAVRAGIPVFVAMSRPTSRAAEAAKFFNVTLVDMAKDSHRIYSHARRIQGF